MYEHPLDGPLFWQIRHQNTMIEWRARTDMNEWCDKSGTEVWPLISPSPFAAVTISAPATSSSHYLLLQARVDEFSTVTHLSRVNSCAANSISGGCANFVMEWFDGTIYKNTFFIYSVTIHPATPTDRSNYDNKTCLKACFNRKKIILYLCTMSLFDE
jgi:hypothetical protein